VLRGLLNDVPIEVLVLGVVALVIAAVLLAVWLLRRFVPPTREGFDAEVSSQILGSIAALFGLLLAFVIVVEFQNFEDAQGSVSGEADGLATIVRNSHAFPAADGARVRAAVGAYARAVAEDEWPRMRSGHLSARASRGLDAMYGALQATEPRSRREAAFYDASVRELSDVLVARRDRLDAVRGGLPTLLVALMVFGSCVIVAYAAMVGSRSFGYHAMSAIAVAVLIGFSLVVLLDLSFPFSGDFSIEPDAFKEGALAQFFPV
jgi:hypothetical protein